MSSIRLTHISLKETLEAANYCLSYDKYGFDWGHQGKLGFPAAILLLSFIDAAGFLLLVKGTDSDKGEDSVAGKNFEIVRDPKYFEPSLSQSEKENLYQSFRSFLIHQSTLKYNTGLSWSNPPREKVVETRNGVTYLNLEILYKSCEKLYIAHEQEIKEKSN